jgi:hypothetical protein
MVRIDDPAEVIVAKTIVNADRLNPSLRVKFLCRCQGRTSYQNCGSNEQYSKPIHKSFLSGQVRLPLSVPSGPWLYFVLADENPERRFGFRASQL